MTQTSARIEKVPFDEVPWYERRHAEGTTAESKAVYALEVGEAIQMPCRWQHVGKNSCTGTQTVFSIGRRKGRKFRTRCKDGVFYVGRVA